MTMAVTQDSEQAYIVGTPASTTVWEKHALNLNSRGWLFKAIAQTAGFLEWSWDGKEVHGRLDVTTTIDDKVDLTNFHKGTVWIRGGIAAKIWAWI